jgi:hypothetical protein
MDSPEALWVNKNASKYKKSQPLSSFQGDEIPKPESMLEANIKATYFRSIDNAKDLYVSEMQEATKTGR